MTRRGLEIGALAVLCLGALYTVLAVFAFSQGRFFTIDEYQYGHATWLVAQGQLPYRDFFEHHFPLSYVLHAPLFSEALAGDRPFDSSALLLRRIVFASWLALGVLTAWCGYRITKDRLAAVLLGFMPLAFGFGLMSAVDYRADNFGAIYLGAALVLLERNRRDPKRGIATLAGLLMAMAAATTQKMAFVGGCTVALLLLADALGSRFAPGRTRFVARPVAFLSAAAGLGLAGIATLAALGILPQAIELTLVQAAEHERYYEAFSVFGKGYVQPFWQTTWPATGPTLAFALLFLLSREGRFWLAPVAAAALASALVVAPYPYNFVLLCWLLSVAAVRGFAAALRWSCERMPAVADVAPLLYLLPLAAVSVQLRFVEGTTSNEHQLGVLRKIEAHGEPGAAVIDNAGGAMFSPHASYYYLHGDAHRRMFRDYFENHLVDDYRRSQALFWIRDGRFPDLPKPARDYLQRHYVHGGDGLYVLGMRTPAAREARRSVAFPVVRAGEYRFHPTTGASRAELNLLVDGKAPREGRMQLGPGPHEIEIRAGAPSYYVAPVEASFFDADPAPPRYTMMFEYGERQQPVERTAFDLTRRFETASERSHAQLDDGKIEQSPGSRLRFHLALPDAAPRLRGHVALRGDAPPEGRVVVEIRSESRQDTLVSEPLREPMRHPGRRIDASLADYAGEMVEISVHFDAKPGDRSLRWSRLRVDEALASAGASEEAEATRIPRGPANLMIVLFDTLRADRTEPYGSERVKTPALARLAERGVTFVDTHANASWTAPSVASLLTSVYPSVHGISGTGWMKAEEARVTSLNEGLPYLPEILDDAGYATVAIVKNPFFHGAFGFGRGFDTLHGLYKERRDIREHLLTPEAQADAVWDELIAPLAAPGEAPFFVYLHELDPHHPYDPLPPFDELYPSDWQGDRDLVKQSSFGFVYRRRPEVLAGGGVEYLDAQYDGEVSFMDAYLGRLLERLEDSGCAEDTLVVFLSDHGEALTEHGIVGHGLRLYEELLRVPLLFSLPGRLPEGVRVESPVELLDLPVTVLDLLGMADVVPDGMQGRSLVPLMEGQLDTGPRPAFAQAVFGQLYSYDSVRYGDWKLIRKNPVGEAADEDTPPSYELYQLAADPRETTDLWQEHPLVGNTLRAMLEWQQVEDSARQVSTEANTTSLDAEMRQNLQALGYLE